MVPKSQAIRHIMNQDIENIGKYLENKFSLRLSETHEWHKLRESFYRRNVVVHNNGIADSRYSNKVRNTRIGMRLDVDNGYLIQSFDVLQLYTKIINAFFYERYFKS